MLGAEWCAQDLALPAFIASRTDAKAGVFALIGELFSDDIGDLLTSTFDIGLKESIDDLKSRLSDGHSTEVDTCLLTKPMKLNNSLEYIS